MNQVPPGSPAPTMRVTQSDIARAAGVHNTTVSLALRNSRAIPEHTRNRIRALAEEMGYYPDPALRALVAYRNRRVAGDRREPIAFITNGETKWGWRDRPVDRQFHEGALRAAARFGYQLEHFWLGEPGLSQRRLSHVLFHRGIRGAIVAVSPADSDELNEFDWTNLSAVCIGAAPSAPTLHRVAEDHAGAVRMAFRHILALGYRRIGLVLPKAWDDASDQAWSTGFLVEQSRLPTLDRIPLLSSEAGEPDPVQARSDSAVVDAGEFSDWINEWEPEVIVSSWPVIASGLSKLRLSVPRDLAFVDLLHDGVDRTRAGVRQNSDRVGEVAAEILVGQMQQNLCGIPNVPTVTLVEGLWFDGDSLPARIPKHPPCCEIGGDQIESPKPLKHVA